VFDLTTMLAARSIGTNLNATTFGSMHNFGGVLTHLNHIGAGCAVRITTIT
jgi:hypothetical protein